MTLAYTSLRPKPDRQAIQIIDQTRLPHALVILELTHLEQVVEAIKTMQLRGAPLIGAAAAFGLAFALKKDSSDSHLDRAYQLLLETRPTAVNLLWALQRVRNKVQTSPKSARAEIAWLEAKAICAEDMEINRRIGEHGLALLEQLAAEKKAPLNILTHCNAGALATLAWGTATAPIYLAQQKGLALQVWVSETRPRLQGASLTAWELEQHNIPHSLIVDSASAHLLQRGMVDIVLVGADRVTRHGDVCNKIGTYSKALAAWDNHIPFYVASPSPSIDWTLENGIRDIPIEQRDGKEVTHFHAMSAYGETQSWLLAPKKTPAVNFAFDVTPARLITGLITERGIVRANRQELARLFPDFAV